MQTGIGFNDNSILVPRWHTATLTYVMTSGLRSWLSYLRYLESRMSEFRPTPLIWCM